MSDVRRKLTTFRMATSREKLKAHRKKLSESRTSVRLLEPIADASPPEKIKTKIRSAEKPRSALVVGESRSMDMEVG
jgi:large subunit ribosomal protein L24e